MAIVVPSDQIPTIQGEDIHLETQWSMLVVPSGSNTIVTGVSKSKRTGFIYVTFLATKAPNDIISTRTPLWGTGAWVIPPQYAPSQSWVTIDGSKYTSLMPSNTRITMSDTSDFLVYDTARFTIPYLSTTATCYAVVTAISANAYIDLAPSWGQSLPSYTISNLSRLRSTGTNTGYNFVSAKVHFVHRDTLPQVCNIVETWYYSDPYYT